MQDGRCRRRKADDGDCNVPLSVSNVSGTRGAICIGANALPKYKTPHTLASLPAFLLSIPNGDHSFNALNNKLNLQYRDLLEHLKDKEPSYYYSDVLIPNEKTLKDFIGG